MSTSVQTMLSWHLPCTLGGALNARMRVRIMGRCVFAVLGFVLASGSASACAMDLKALLQGERKPLRLMASVIFVGELTEMKVSSRFGSIGEPWSRAYQWTFDVREILVGDTDPTVVVHDSKFRREPQVELGESYVVAVHHDRVDPLIPDGGLIFAKHFCDVPYVYPDTKTLVDASRRAEMWSNQ